MENLYSKLYDKYTKLKGMKFAEMEQINKEQEVKFLNYMSAAEELIEHLKNESDELRVQIDGLRSELTSVRLTKEQQVAEYQKLILEETKKNEVLSEEVEKLQKARQETIQWNSRDGLKNESPISRFKTPDNSPGKMTSKRSRETNSETSPDNSFIRVTRLCRSMQLASKEIDDCYESGKKNTVARDSAKDLHNQIISSEFLRRDAQLECPPTTVEQSGLGLKGVHSNNWLIQVLFEYILGMKLSLANQNGLARVIAEHQSSGYSFSLTWMNKATGEEVVLLYHVQSLGTFEKIAPEWMKEDIMFSTTMCAIFFERLSRVVKLQI